MVKRTERADAARNRIAILRAAELLIAASGDGQVSMDEIASAAGVGKGTLFRRFGDRDNLLLELFEQVAEDWEATVLPRLGDGSIPAAERVARFMADLFDGIVMPARPILRAMTRGHFTQRRFEQHLRWQQALAAAVHDANPGLNAEFVAHSLLSLPRADYIDLLNERIGLRDEEIRAGLIDVAYATVTGAPIPDDLRARLTRQTTHASKHSTAARH